MADGRRRDEWKRTARLCAILANCHRDAEKRPTPFVDADFDPFDDKARRPPAKSPITALRVIFVPKDSEPEIWPPQTSVPVPLTSN